MSEELKQDRAVEARHIGTYMMWLLFEQPVEVPYEQLAQALEQRLGEVDVVVPEGKLCSFAVPKYKVRYEGGQEVPAQMMIGKCIKDEKPLGDVIERSQLWNVPNGAELLDNCPYRVMLTDFMAGGLEPLARAQMLSDLLEAALAVLPECVAVYAAPSGMLRTAEDLRHNPYEGAMRFIHFGVNGRFFNIQGTEESVVDTLGLYALGLPDVQVHYKGLEAGTVVHYACNVAIYQFMNGAPIENGHTIGGIKGDEHWRCQYEDSLIQPVRAVLDVEPGEYAAGNRKDA